MRSHAEASFARSTRHRAAGRGRLLRGATATAFALVALSIAAIPADAGQTHVLSGSFGAVGTGDGQFSLAEHSGVAVNETTHDVYVADTGNHRVDQFDSAGNFIRAFGADVGGAGINVCATGCVEGTAGSAPGAFEAPTFVAVDNSSGPSKGDLYVADTANNVVSKFQADGVLVSSWAEGGQLHGSPMPGEPATEVGFSLIAGITVGSGGALAIFEVEPRVLLTFSEDGAFSAESGETPRGSAAVGLAVDPDGNFFKVNGNFTVEKFEVSGGDVGQVNSSEAKGLGIDPSSGELFVDNGASIEDYAFGPSGEVIGSGCTPASFEGCSPSTSFGAGDLASGGGLTVDGAVDTVYVVDVGAGEVLSFTAALLPDVTTEAATEVENDSAVLNGTVNASGGPEASCEFQYTTEEAFQSEGFASPTSLPCSPPGPFSGSATEAVSAEATGLIPSTSYRFRIVAANENGSSFGQVRRFFAPTTPTVGVAEIESVGTTDATIATTVKPGGTQATYRLEYGTTASYGQSTPESAPIGFEGDESDHTVRVHIGGLQPGTAYHFRFVATNVAGIAEGADTTFATYPVPSPVASCPNDQFRSGFGARLPDCRAYEQATPTDKKGANVQGFPILIQASGKGDRVTFYLSGGLPTTGGSSAIAPFLASRGPSGWSFDGLLPATDPDPRHNAGVVGWNEDISTAVALAPGPGDAGQALYLRDSDSGAFQLGPASSESNGLQGTSLAGFSDDDSHLIFESKAALAPGAIPSTDSVKTNLYDLDHGTITLVGRIPSGSATSCDDLAGPACVPAPEGAFAGPYYRIRSSESSTDLGGASVRMYTQNTISRDGSRVFFTTRNRAQLYVREDAAKTTRISASQRSVPDPNGEKPAAFMAATPDGSKVFFTSCEKLTEDSTAFSTAANSCTEIELGKYQQEQDLYSYDVETGELTDLTVDENASDPRGAAVQGVLGASDDGSYVYFVAEGVLAPGASSSASGPVRNLYVSHDGSTTFIAALNFEDEELDWTRWSQFFGKQKVARVSADGDVLVFGSVQGLTGYDNRPSVEIEEDQCSRPEGALHCTELFRYSAPSDELVCVSCNPSGIRPVAPASFGMSGPRVFLSSLPNFTFLTRNLSADGNRVFFESHDALVPSDTNGVIDVYEWEADGSGSCDSKSQNGGCIYLLSSGTSSSPSYFGDASATGDHVFLFTVEPLVPNDRDQLVDVYDAAVGGGLAGQHTLAPPTCTSAACQANPPPPPDQTLSSAAFSGPGNAHKPSAARKCPKGKRRVRHAGKVRCRKAGKQHKRHSNRGGSK